VVFAPLRPHEVVRLERGGTHLGGERACGHLPPPALLEDDADDAVVVASRHVEFPLVGLVGVDEELLLGGLFFQLLGFFLAAASQDVSSAVCLTEERGTARLAKSVSRALLGRQAGRHVRSHHPILFINCLV